MLLNLLAIPAWATFLISLREAVGGLVKEGKISVRLTLDGLRKLEKKKIKVGEKSIGNNV